jgi:hypothetical protein
MAAQPLGELWISLCPTEEELRDCGSRLNYQQQIILEIIERFRFNRQVFIQPPQMGTLSRVPTMLRHLHQLIHFNHTSDYIVIQDIPEITEEQL